MQKKLYRITTVPESLNALLKGQLKFLNSYYKVTAISSPGQYLEEVREREGVETIAIKMKREISIFNDLISFVKLFCLFVWKRPCIVHANTPKASLLSMLAAKMALVPHRIYTVTGLRFETTTGLRRKVLIAMEKITCWAAIKVIPEGVGVSNTLRKNRITKKELKVVGNGNINGIDTDYYTVNHFSEIEKQELKNKLNILSSDCVFCFIGRIVKDKGINELVEAFVNINKNHPNIKLLLVGPFEQNLDPIEKKTEQFIKTHQNILLVGFQHDVRPYLAISDIFVFPSYREGFPNSIMQAGAMDLPCIVTNINGSNEIVIDGVNGIIIPSKNIEELQNAMLDLLQNKKRQKEMSSVARKMIKNRYEQSYIWSELHKMYQSLESL